MICGTGLVSSEGHANVKKENKSDVRYKMFVPQIKHLISYI